MYYEATNSENRDSKIPTKNAHDVGAITVGLITADKQRKIEEQRLKTRYDNVGSNPQEKIIQGREDRIKATFNMNNYSDPKDQRAYWQGFVENGGRVLDSNLDSFTEEQLKQIGINDCNAGLKVNDIPENIWNNSSYRLGYEEASLNKMMVIIGKPQIENQKPKGRR